MTFTPVTVRLTAAVPAHNDSGWLVAARVSRFKCHRREVRHTRRFGQRYSIQIWTRRTWMPLHRAAFVPHPSTRQRAPQCDCPNRDRAVSTHHGRDAAAIFTTGWTSSNTTPCNSTTTTTTLLFTPYITLYLPPCLPRTQHRRTHILLQHGLPPVCPVFVFKKTKSEVGGCILKTTPPPGERTTDRAQNKGRTEQSQVQRHSAEEAGCDSSMGGCTSPDHSGCCH